MCQCHILPHRDCGRAHNDNALYNDIRGHDVYAHYGLRDVAHVLHGRDDGNVFSNCVQC